MAAKVRLASLVSHPIQYQAPLFRALARHPDIDFTAVFLSTHGVAPTLDPGFGQVIAFDVPLLEGYRSHFVRNRARRPHTQSFFGAVNPSLAALLVRERFDALWVHGYAQASNWIAFATAAALRLPFLIRGDSQLLVQSGLRSRSLRQLVLGSLSRAARALLYIGEQNRHFYEAFGVPSDKLFFAPYGVDNAFYAERAEAARAAGRRESLRACIGAAPDDVVLLVVGKLVGFKQPLDVVRALSHLDRRAIAVFVGDGELRADVEAEIATTKVRGLVTGFINQSDLPDWYAAGDVTVLASDFEKWGLVINEAMACGLPAVVSDLVGCAPDLVRPHETGMVFRARDPEALAAALRPLLEQPELRTRLGEAARQLVARYDVTAAADGIAAAALAVARTRQRAKGSAPQWAGEAAATIRSTAEKKR
jgi:glycosyltransferase involved in cell wall biosynthesis